MESRLEYILYFCPLPARFAVDLNGRGCGRYAADGTLNGTPFRVHFCGKDKKLRRLTAPVEIKRNQKGGVLFSTLNHMIMKGGDTNEH